MTHATLKKYQEPTEDNEITANDVELTQIRRQEVIASIDIAINQQHQLKILLNQIVEVVTVFLPSTGGSSIFLWNKEIQEFEKSASTLENQDGKEASRRIRNQGGATRWIVDNQKPVIVSDIYEDSFVTNPNLKVAKVLAYVGVPLLIDSECIGVLYALSKEKRAYDKADIQFLQNLAIRAAVAIKNITLLEEMKQTNKTIEENLESNHEKSLLKSPLNYEFNKYGSLKVTQQATDQVFSQKEVFLLNNITQHINVISHSYLLAQTLQSSEEMIVKSREEERKRIHRDLHDGLGPTLASTALQLETARQLMHTNPERGETILRSLEAKMLQTLTSVRSLVHNLYPSLIDQFGLEEALNREIKNFESNQLSITLDIKGNIENLEAATEVAIYRIIKEAVHNVHKHAKASKCQIAILCTENTIQINICDNGVGLPKQLAHGIGLQSIQERAEELAGVVHLINNQPSGLCIRVVLPLNKEQ